MRKQLKPRELRFVAAYQRHGNATLAAAEAGYSPRNPANAGWRLLRRPLIQQALAMNPEARPLVELPSGVQVSFSYQGKPLDADTARWLSDRVGSRHEQSIWRGALGLYAGVFTPEEAAADQLAQLRAGQGGPPAGMAPPPG